MNFEVLEYKKAGKVGSLSSTWAHVEIDMKLDDGEVKKEVKKHLKEILNHEIEDMELIMIDRSVDVIEIMNKEGKEVVQLRGD